MQTPVRARRKTGTKPKMTPAKAPKAEAAAAAEPTIRDDAWWLARIAAWKAVAAEGAEMPRGKLAFWLALEVDERANDGEPMVSTNLDRVLERWVEGESFQQLAAYLTALFGFRVSHWALRKAVMYTPEGLAKYNVAREHQAHRLVEQALDEADLASKDGDYRFAAEFRLKLAGKLRPEEYGDRTQLEIGGIKGRPIENHVVQSPAEAYRAALGGEA